MRPLDLTDFLLITIASALTDRKPEDIFKEYDKQRPKTSKPTSQVKEEDVEEIYAAYPTRDPGNGNRSLGKSMKDRDRIRRLLTALSKETILAAIKSEIEESKTTGKWLKNFATFLNNLPDAEGIGVSKKDSFWQ